jgi:hypothetical protein
MNLEKRRRIDQASKFNSLLLNLCKLFFRFMPFCKQESQSDIHHQRNIHKMLHQIFSFINCLHIICYLIIYCHIILHFIIIYNFKHIIPFCTQSSLNFKLIFENADVILWWLIGLSKLSYSKLKYWYFFYSYFLFS